MASCPHCGGDNPDGAAFCASCGKALPTGGTPRVTTGEDFAHTAVGRGLQADQLRKQSSSASTWLFLVAALMAIGGMVVWGMLQNKGEEARKLATTLMAVNLGLAGLFAALGVWARFNPLPASIVGLVLFITLQVVNVVIDPTTIAQGILVKILVIAALAKAVSAGLKYKQLMAQSSA